MQGYIAKSGISCFDTADTCLHARLHCIVGNQGILLKTPLTPHPNFSAFRLDCRMSIRLGLASSLQAHQSTAMPQNRVDRAGLYWSYELYGALLFKSLPGGSGTSVPLELSGRLSTSFRPKMLILSHLESTRFLLDKADAFTLDISHQF